MAKPIHQQKSKTPDEQASKHHKHDPIEGFRANGKFGVQIAKTTEIDGSMSPRRTDSINEQIGSQPCDKEQFHFCTLTHQQESREGKLESAHQIKDLPA